ncbi:MAG: hypothetical protein RMJ16_15350, partial [Thermoguttaceae bacterium]|nr:hypothetical protein [Thermoguttaceae bacterium]
PTTGRPAYEWLCFYVPGLSDVPQENKTNICYFLNNKFPDLQNWINEQDWAKVSAEAVTCPLIDDWQAKLSHFVPDSLPRLRAESLESESRASARKRRAVQTPMVVLLIVLAAGVATGQIRFPKISLPPIGPCVPRVEPPAFQPLAETLGLPQDAKEDQIAQKLKSVVASSSTMGMRNSRQIIGLALCIIDQSLKNSQQDCYKADPKQLAQLPSVLRAVSELFPPDRNHNFDPLGILRARKVLDEGELTWAEGATYPELVRLVNAFARLNETDESSRKKIAEYFSDYPPEGWTNSIILGLQALVKSPPILESFRQELTSDGLRRTFFVETDLPLIRNARRICDEFLFALNTDPNAKSWLKLKNAWTQPQGASPSMSQQVKNAVDVCKKRYTEARHPDLKTAWGLLAEALEEADRLLSAPYNKKL